MSGVRFELARLARVNDVVNPLEPRSKLTTSLWPAGASGKT
jgi:hypothetical protein